jgi:hypothetical protein
MYSSAPHCTAEAAATTTLFKMVTTFNDRIITLNRTFAPLVDKPSALLSRDPWNTNTNTNISSTGMKRHVPSTFYAPPPFAPSARHISAADAKRRRLDELHYTAATIHQALENAGRPPVSQLTRRIRALPITVNTESCIVISSAEYDASTAAAAVVEKSVTAANADDANNTQDGHSSVDEMLLYASLIQSSRHYYGFVDTASLVTPKESTNNDEDIEEEELRASSDTTSTWAPSSICNQVNLNDKKSIDNDNRSDGTSSNPASSSSGEEERSDISFSDQFEGAEASPSPIATEKDSSNGNILGNENNGSNYLDNNGNRNNDGAENDYGRISRSRRNSETTFTASNFSGYCFTAG